MELKKNAVDLTELAIGVIVLGIVVSIGAYILVTWRDSKLTDLKSYTTTNETVTPSASGDKLANIWCKSVSSCVNSTDGASISAGNYSVTTDGIGYCTVTNTTSTFPGSWKCTYDSYNTTSRADYSLANSSAQGIGEFGNWFKIIVIVGIAAVVLSLIFMAFGNRGQQSTGTY